MKTKTRMTHVPFWPTLWRYRKTLRKDVSFRLSATMLCRILLIAVLGFCALEFLGRRAEVYTTNRDATSAASSAGDVSAEIAAAAAADGNTKERQHWKQFVLSLTGSLDA